MTEFLEFMVLAISFVVVVGWCWYLKRMD